MARLSNSAKKQRGRKRKFSLHTVSAVVCGLLFAVVLINYRFFVSQKANGSKNGESDNAMIQNPPLKFIERTGNLKSPQRTGKAPESRETMLFRAFEGAMPKARQVPKGNKMCPPNYLILGVRKSGTTSLHRYLSSSHPEIYPYAIPGVTPGYNIDTVTKEGLEVLLAQAGEAFGKVGTEKYSKKFGKIPSDKVFGESTVSRNINEAPGLAKFCKDSKFFLLIRDPVSRCHSQFLMSVRLKERISRPVNEKSNLTARILLDVQAFERRVEKNDNLAYQEFPKTFMGSATNCLYEGAYVLHLRRLIGSGIDPSQLRIYFTQDMEEYPEMVVKDALHHIGLSSQFIDEEVFQERFNFDTSTKNKNRPDNLELTWRLKEQMKKDMEPFDRELMKFLDTDYLPWRPEWGKGKP